MSQIPFLQLRELVCGVGNQLRYVDRFATCRRNHNENVAEHQYYTAFFSLVIALHLPEIDMARLATVISRALVHDIEEHCTGDVIRPIKHGTEEIKKGFELAGEKFCNEFFSKITSSTPVRYHLQSFWKESKDETREGRIVKFADFLSVLAYLDQEVRSGNRLIMANVNELSLYHNQFLGKDFEFIRSLVDDSYGMILKLEQIGGRN